MSALACVNVNEVHELIGLLAASHMDAASHIELTSVPLFSVRQGLHSDDRCAEETAQAQCTAVLTTLVGRIDGSGMNRR